MTTQQFTNYYVAKQAEREWAVAYINGLGHSRIYSTHKTRREALRKASQLNSGERAMAAAGERF